jgi:hypothetical protein
VQKVKFGLGHGALQSEQQSVVEIRWIVAPELCAESSAQAA